jgi:transposase
VIREKTHHYASRVPSADDQPAERPVAGCFGVCVERLQVELARGKGRAQPPARFYSSSHKYICCTPATKREGVEAVDLTDEQWAVLEPLIPEPPRRPDRRGRPWRDTREVLDGVLWVLRTGARWRDLPETCPPYQTCHRRFQRWVRDGTLKWVLTALAKYLRERGVLDLTECFIDGTFVAAKKGEVM